MTLKIFIERPVLSTVISVIIVILGILGLIALPITQYPEIAPPTVQVSASYPGANADVVLNSVIVPLEEQINGVENMSYMTSTASNDGSASITVFFKQGTNPDLDAVNVQNRVSRATPLLPAEVTRSGVTTSKRQSSMVMVFSINSRNKSFDATFLQNYANINVIPMLKRVNGVGDVTAFGTHDYSMRIWLKPDAMAAYGLIPDDISNALAEQNIEAAPGKIGENSNQSFQYVLKYKGRLKTPQEYDNIIIKATSTGQLLHLRDVARVELGSLDYSVTSSTDNNPSIVIAVFQAAGSNAHAMIKQCEQTIATAEKSFPPGVFSDMIFTANQFLDISINKVVETLIEAFILVSIVVFVFLQDLRSTLIPAIAVPVAIVGTFFFLQLFGFTINLLTLFALVLAIGIVVDDAIVVVEAVHSKLDQHVPTARQATLEAMNEISGAVVSITLVMAAVFIPVTFITGSVGVFYKQFGLTLAVAILISALNALTLSPALCALLLKPHGENKLRSRGFMQRFYAAFNAGFSATTNKYKRAVQFLSRRRWIAAMIVLGFIALFAFLLKATPSGFVPNEDQSFIMADISLPPASSLERTTVIADSVVKIARGLPEMNSVVEIAGSGIMSGNGGSYGALFMNLKSWDERKGDEHSVNAVVNRLFGATAGIKGATVIFMAPPTLEGFGNSSGFEFQVQDHTGGDIRHFADVTNQFLADLSRRPEIQYATSFFNVNFPQYEVEVNVAKCKESNISPATVLSTMQGYYGSLYASNFNEFGKQYRVMIEADAAYRSDVQSLDKVFVRTGNNVMAPITEFVTLKRVYGPEFINRFNLFTSIAVNGAPKPGYSSGDAIRAIQEVAKKSLPVGYGYEFSGLTREELSSGNQTMLIFVLCLIFVYFLLSAQYESYILPFAVILSLSIGLSGAFLFANLFGVQNNIYLQITLIMLIGLLAKNAILIVEFALARRRAGESIVRAAVDGAVARLRPILMTSFAFIFGIMPLMVSSGAGAAGNRSIGTGAVGGMLIGTVFGVFVIPALFVMFQMVQERISRKPKARAGAGAAVVITLLFGTMAISSCVTRKYQSPGMAVKGSLYRSDSTGSKLSADTAKGRVSANAVGDTIEERGDTVTMATLPYRALFADTILQGLIGEGLRENPDLNVAMQRVNEARENFFQSRVAALPDLSAGPTVTRSRQSAAALDIPPAYIGSFPLTTTTYQFALNSSWEADIWGKLRSAKRSYLATFFQTEAARRVVQTQLVADIATYYYQLLSYDEQLRITQQTVTNRADDVSTMKALKESGLATGAAVVQSEANRASAELLIPDLKRNIHETENALSILLGRVPGEIRRATLAEQVPFAALHVGVSSLLMQNRPDVLEAEFAFRAAFENVNVAKTYFYPQLTITAQGGYSNLTIKDFFLNSVFYNLVGGLTQPIFNKRLNKTRLHVAQAQQAEAFYSYQKTLLTAGMEVSNSLYSYETALGKQGTRREEIQSLEKAVDFTKELLKYSSATNYTDVLTSEQSLLAAQLDGVNDKLQELQAIVDLYEALGGGWQ